MASVIDACTGVTCSMPPANDCTSANEFKAYDSIGSCKDGACTYASRSIACNCGGGQCVSDPCAGLACASPPTASCKDLFTKRTFAAAGTCAGGSCTYDSVDSNCAFGCVSGACSADPCASVTCKSPPAAVCKNGTLTQYSSSGTCNAGTCSYTSTNTICSFGCAAGACNPDPCAGITCNQPPASDCVAGQFKSYDATGSCAAGTCTYGPHTLACTCQGHSCSTDPCLTVTCATPPAAICQDTKTQRKYTSQGTCSAGSCSYAPVDTTCTFGCKSGACNPDPCSGVTCNAPPAAQCSGNILTTYTASGATCSNGLCTYKSTPTTCPFGCAASACKPDPCLGITCKTPPIASCGANGLTTYQSPGQCSGGTCNYASSTAACTGGKQCSIASGVAACQCPTGTTICSGQCKNLATDAGNCGGCGLTCSLPCTKGECLIPLASSQIAPTGLAVDETTASVYWTNAGNIDLLLFPKVNKVSRTGGAVVELHSGEDFSEQYSDLAVDGSNVYWTTGGFGTVMKVAVGGGAAIPLASSLLGSPGGIVVSGSNVYWSEYNSSFIVKASRVDGSSAHTISTGNLPSRMAIDSQFVYWVEAASLGSVSKVSVNAPDFTDSTPLAPNQAFPTGITVDGTNVYWTTAGGGTVMRARKSDGGSPTPLASGQATPVNVVVDGTYAYWTNSGDGTVRKTLLAGGGTVAIMADKQGGPTGLAVDGTSLYWTNVTSGTVMKLTPK